jgi:hypothetical protein
MPQIKLKYEADISAFDPGCKSCPPIGAAPMSKKAFRWVANPMTTACFLPPGKKDPRRVNNTKGAANCGLFGVSMHISQQHSIDAFKKLEASFIEARKTLGGYVAEGALTVQDGLCTAPNQVGHFDLYEFDTANLKNSFVMLGVIPK